MPTYDYECTGCGHTFEMFQSIKEKPIRKCPECGKMRAKRLIGAGAGIIFRGSGFYETDYRSDHYKKQAKAEKEASKPASSSSDSKGDSSKSGSSGNGKD